MNKQEILDINEVNNQAMLFNGIATTTSAYLGGSFNHTMEGSNTLQQPKPQVEQISNPHKSRLDQLKIKKDIVNPAVESVKPASVQEQLPVPQEKPAISTHEKLKPGFNNIAPYNSQKLEKKVSQEEEQNTTEIMVNSIEYYIKNHNKPGTVGTLEKIFNSGLK